MRAARGWLALVALTLFTARARAHDFDPGVLAIVEAATGSAATHRFRLTQPVDTRAPGSVVRVRFPAGCVVDERAQTLACAPGAFSAQMAFEGLERGGAGARMIVSFTGRGGAHTDRVIEGDAPFTLDDGGGLRVAAAWAVLGARHLAGGPDHLAFLLCLVCLVRRPRALVLAITAFSAGHAASLGLSASGALSLPVAPIEGMIALSVVLMAREALRAGVVGPPSLVARAPFVASGCFGLLHGLGFASALGEAGFPREGLWLALGAFHVGVELTQLAFCAALALAWQGAQRALTARAQLARRAALVAAGSAGAAWTLERTLGLLGW